MNLTSKKLWSFVAGGLWAALSGAPALADDVELFIGSANASNQARPNILFILDDSGSMASTVYTQVPYDPSGTYTGDCNVSRVYWTTGTTVPSCNNNNQNFNLTALHCKRALDAFTTGGSYQDVMVSYDNGSQKRWETLNSGSTTRPVECQADFPDSSIAWAGHGSTAAPTPEVYPKNTNVNDLWTDDPNADGNFSWGGSQTNTTYWLYNGKYLNWYHSPGVPDGTRLQVMKDVAHQVLNSINGVNVGLMNFSNLTLTAGSEGGPVRYAMENITTARAGMLTSINGLTATLDPPSKYTPLSETLYESTLYWMGRPVRFGLGTPQSVANSRTVAASGNPSEYISPIGLSCQKNHLIVLTDGQPTYDQSANSAILDLEDEAGETFEDLVGATCDAETYPSDLRPIPNDGLQGVCLDDLAEFLHDGDMSPLAGQQNVTVHTVGFTVDLPVLKQAAERGGGKYYTATDTASLTNALTDILTNIIKTQTTFTSPAVSVNSFNRTRNLNDLFISVFRPSATEHWPGNLKRYRLRVSDGKIVDVHGEPAVDPATGFFAKESQSYWSDVVDGFEVHLGGAANEIPAARNVYTYFPDNPEPDLTASVNRVELDNNTGITNALLTTGAADLPTRDEVINFINGIDASDVDNDEDLAERRNQMGDPLHSQPASVIYGPTVEDALIFVATNNGYLHAIDPTDGSEKWAFVPEEFLDEQVGFFVDSSTVTKTYGIDGSLRVQMIRDEDGTIEPLDGERVYLFFGVRRGGDIYYGLDVTDPDKPRVMWRHDSSSLPGIGETWAAPTPARINIQGAPYDDENDEQLVLVIGGGYDTDQDNATPSPYDDVGNTIYIIDSVSGTKLWRASNAGADQNFSRTDDKSGTMKYSIPADIKVVDLNTDGYADRMYAADMGGQVWRFDIHNGQPKETLTTGGVIAKLGSAASATPTVADTRRFYYSPDVALVNTATLKYIHIGVGSGHRAHPNSVVHQDRFYAVRDFAPFAKLPQADYDGRVPLVDGDLVDITDTLTPDMTNAKGWRFELRDGGWIGEKVLSEARTFNNQVFFTTFRPGISADADPCIPSLGTNRLYVMSLFDGSPVMNLDGEEGKTLADRHVEFAGSIAAEVVFLFPSPDDPDCEGEECTPPPVACVDLFCLPTGYSNAPIRTFWSQETTD